MEITNREDLGADLEAPQRDASSNESWSYTLVSYVEPGAIIFHWHASIAGEPALVGWSEATGTLEGIDITWQARGSAGRSRGVPTTGAG